MKNIGLIDVDCHNFPSQPLMKISAYHKRQGDYVSFYEPLKGPYDRVYMSKVFDFTDDYSQPIYAHEIIKGGTGYDLMNRLPDEIEHIYPDYGLYGITDKAYGFLTRGCPRCCGFCIVGKKEGAKSVKVSDLSAFWHGQKEIVLLDPNILACADYAGLLHQLIDSKALVNFTQGLDIRLMTGQATELLKKCKTRTLYFAWDTMKDSEIILDKLKAFKDETGISARYAKVYVLTNFDTPFEFDLERVYTLREMGYDPYIMVYDKQNAPARIRQLQRWVNNKIIFYTVKRFEDYKT